MKKGFTLIELLAVIIILAIVALIATPLILNVIETAEKSASRSETQLILGSIEKGCATAALAVQLDGATAEDIETNHWCTDGTTDGTTAATAAETEAIIGGFTNLGEAEITTMTSIDNGMFTGTITSKGHAYTIAGGKITN